MGDVGSYDEAGIPVNSDSSSSLAQRRAHNSSLGPISSLPPELLCIIFLFNTVEDSSVFAHKFWKDLSTRSTLSAAQVCHVWRQAALGCAALWCRLIDYASDSAVWIEEMLRRSKEIPLFVSGLWSVYERPHDLDARIDLILKCLFRTHALRLEGVSLTKNNLEKLNKPAPLLEKLILHPYIAGFCERTRRDPIAWEDLKISSLFAGHAPKLRVLSICYYSVDFSSSIFSNLTHLSVVGVRSVHMLPVFEWLTVLRQMPALEHLALYSCFSIPEHANLLCEHVDLPALSMISLQGYHDETAALLSSLRTSVPCSLKLSSHHPLESAVSMDVSLAMLVSSIRVLLTSWPKLHLRQAIILYLTILTLRLSNVSPLVSPPSNSLLLDIEFTCLDISDMPAPGLLLVLLRQLGDILSDAEIAPAVTNVDIIIKYHNSIHGRRKILAFLHCFENVTHWSALGEGAVRFFAAVSNMYEKSKLGSSRVHTEQKTIPLMLFPRLRHLTLTEADFVSYPGPHIFEGLLQFVRQRQEWTHTSTLENDGDTLPLFDEVHLYVSRGVNLNNRLARLRELVTVVWDKVEADPRMEDEESDFGWEVDSDSEEDTSSDNE